MPQQERPATRTATFEARYLTAVPKAIDLIKGSRPVMVSYKFGKIISGVRELHNALAATMQPYALEDKSGLREDLTEEENAEIEALIAEEVSLEVPYLTLEDLADAGLYVNDDSVLVFLIEDVKLLVAE